jgi:hypothetical protein
MRHSTPLLEPFVFANGASAPRALSPRFVEYMRNWKGFVVDEPVA